LKPKNPINAILDQLASQQRRGETSLIVRLEPDLIQDAMNALRSYRKLLAPVIPGLTDTVPIYAAYEQMRQEDVTKHTILLLVECQTMGSSVRPSAGCRFESLLSGALFQQQDPPVPISISHPALRPGAPAYCRFWTERRPADRSLS
jgi:hypothetical protein